MAGCATPASHPGRSATPNHALTLSPDHPMGAGQQDRINTALRKVAGK